MDVKSSKMEPGQRSVSQMVGAYRGSDGDAQKSASSWRAGRVGEP